MGTILDSWHGLSHTKLFCLAPLCPQQMELHLTPHSLFSHRNHKVAQGKPRASQRLHLLPVADMANQAQHFFSLSLTQPQNPTQQSPPSSYYKWMRRSSQNATFPTSHLTEGYSKWGPWISSMDSTWKLVGNANAQVLPQTYRVWHLRVWTQATEGIFPPLKLATNRISLPTPMTTLEILLLSIYQPTTGWGPAVYTF